MPNPTEKYPKTESLSSLLPMERRDLLKISGGSLMAIGLASFLDISSAKAQDMSNGADNFYKSRKINIRKVVFLTQYKTKIAANLFTPSQIDLNKHHSAIIVGHPMGATKEQSANLYATKMAEQGFVTLSFDLPFWGESEGQPRNAVEPELYAEAFSAAVDYLGIQSFVNRNAIGAIGICGSGSFVISAAKIDPRLKAIATISMYDMGSVIRNGLRHSISEEQRKEIINKAALQRWNEAEGGKIEYTGGTDNQLTRNSSAIQREFYDFYRTPRGQYTPSKITADLTTHPTLTSNVKFMNFYPLNDIEIISPRPLLFISGDKAHSKEFSEEAYQRAAEPKELFWVAGAGHVDLYNRVDLIPFDKLTDFFKQYLKA
ncbi:hypothetical protein FBY50_1561 [Zymomonas mobilis]|uniref:alpha/beta hydrolase n=1 Tax=Zymomonas mobilis TaxID=542 RepID=UPI000B3B0316|nr:alpha/beta hydrolase [Zymomonas mobilis]ART93971.1 hypothetical protein B9T50_07545 [Zymomonas mobilis subsp. mobilis]TWD60715.1 hypothetical protein FBY50_1561 [Zymomonas mobilis]